MSDSEATAEPDLLILSVPVFLNRRHTACAVSSTARCARRERIREHAMFSDAGCTTSLHQHKILIVDDELDLLETWTILLELEGFSVLTAYDAAEGFETAITFRPSVVITDYRMPGMNGLDFCRRLKSERSTQSIPIIMWTGSPMVPHDELFERFAVKPVTLGTLISLIREVLH